MLRVLAVLLLIPLFDFLVLVVGVTPLLGVVPTVLLVVLTGLLGMLFVRAEGRRTLRKIRDSLSRGEVPTDELLDGGLLVAAGAFLLTPGVVTDALGFLIVFPITRAGFRWALKRWVVTPYVDAKTKGFATGNVYVGGFPDGDGVPEGDGPRNATSPGDEPYDLGDDAYDVSIDDPEDGDDGED